MLFNLGRVSSYALIGAIAGTLGSGLISAADLPALSAAARGLTGLLMVLIGLRLPIAVALTIAGIALYLIGIFFEWVGDWQLSQFKKDPSNKGEVMDKGLGFAGLAWFRIAWKHAGDN